MEFKFLMPTKVLLGVGCVAGNKEEFGKLGKKALIVTGRNSAKASGALRDVTTVLDEQAIVWELFDQIEENPTFAVVEAGGAAARRFKPDMIIAIGGGSPLDAAKAIAVLAVNFISASELYEGDFQAAPLPIAAVPLTAGTGSEVTPYSILTDSERQTKRSFSDVRIFPQIAFLDARYTHTQSRAVTVNTAVDALSHAIEGYLSKRSTAVSDCLALEAIRSFGRACNALVLGEFDISVREELLYTSLLGGVVIAQTGTTAVHALGYSLTYFYQVPHGRANGLLLGEYLRFNEPVVPQKVEAVLAALGLKTVDEMKVLMSRLLPSSEVYSQEELHKFVAIASEAANIVNTPRQPGKEDLYNLLLQSLTCKA